MPTQRESQESKPDYVHALEKAYGAPSQEGFGSAVFFEQMVDDDDLEELAQKYYQVFVGPNWQEWGEETWMASWKQAYKRPETGKQDIEKELREIEDFDTKMQVEMILDNIEDAEAARKALVLAYDAPEIVDLRLYNIGDGEAMAGLLLAGRRENGEATFLVFLMD